MLCRPAVLNGSQVSILPVARSTRCTPAKPLFCDQTLPSTCELSGLIMFTCVASMFYSAGIGQYWNFSVFGSNLTIAAWYIMPSHRLSSRSARSPSEPFGKPGLCDGDRIFLDRSGLGVEPADELLAEARVPGDAVLIEHDVVRRDGLARQIVFGIDHLGRAALRARQRLQLVLPLPIAAEIDVAEVLGGVR